MTITRRDLAEVQKMLRDADPVVREYLGKGALDCDFDDFDEVRRRIGMDATSLLAQRDQACAELDGIVGRDVRVAVFGEEWERLADYEDEDDGGDD